ncbi:MAG: FHA domain-containing protein [Clostridia bacterium]|nr:FHA domain-containing protein [Clostridia bacterium]
MRADIYSLAVSVMRYFFVAAIIYILIRIVYHSINEYNELRRVKNWIEKGYAKHIEFLPPFDTNENGFILVKTNLIGRSRRCDICIDDRTVKRKHAIIFEKRGDVFIKRKGMARIKINGELMKNRIEELLDGDLVQLGHVRFYYKVKRTSFREEAEHE